ncbi:AAA family ATPase [Sphingomonas sp. HH69]
MNFHLAETFTAALVRLPAQEAKLVKTSVVDLQIDPTGKGQSFHRIERAKDPNFWSVRVSRDLRLIVHKTSASLLVAYVGHHDDAYAWAQRRRIEAHPTTGAIQIVEVRELVESVARPATFDFISPATIATAKTEPAKLFAALDDAALLSIGVPRDWTADVRAATEDGFFTLADHLPAEAAEALLEFATTGKLAVPAPVAAADPYAHPDALRRIRLIADQDELEQALVYPWEKWGVFLHPSQREIVERSYAGPARVAGSAGTGKTVVALHRAVRLARDTPSAKILLASFSQPLADALTTKVSVLAPDTGTIVPRITTASFQGIADQLHQLEFGVRPRIASEQLLRNRIIEAATDADVKGFSDRFLLSEWVNVVDAWSIRSLDEYVTVQRMGRKSRLGPKQRERLWPVFASVRETLKAERYTTWAAVFSLLAARFVTKSTKPFDHIVIDEAQDLGPSELRFFAALAPDHKDALFLAGDLGQRIFQHPYSWKSLGVEVQGRSFTLKVCYRTSQQIRQSADRLLPSVLRDVDGIEDERRGTISVFKGPEPAVAVYATQAEELGAVRAFVESAISDGVVPTEIGIFVRIPALVDRAKASVAGLPGAEDIVINVMHLAKGLEFRAVAVLACDEGILPLDARIEDAADDAEMDDIYETERRLLYVACTRARDRLMVSGVAPASEYLTDMSST